MTGAVLGIVFLFSMVIYLALSAGSGSIIFWSIGEIAFGILFATISAVIACRIFPALGLKPRVALLNPKRWLLLLAYSFGPFLFHLTKANLDVAYRVITGKIRPGIVRISPGLRTSIGITMLANSITLTPGTLTVDIDENKDLYVHWINVDEEKDRMREICHSFPEWIRRVAE
ncbi:MAG: Na+/H+ antiporter subunit E [Candidatus Aenigmarchaeota archaeon]|nr:Na+/H+ antiporter subunit E [Candidatus Aenigmarchaeota archaeon]